MNLLKEENHELTFIVPTCQKCERLMTGFFYMFYKDPNFNTTEAMRSFFWTEVWFQCQKCNGRAALTDQELDVLNSYPIDMVNWPPGFDSKKMKVQRLTNR